METLLVDRSPEGIVTVTLHRPAKKNAIDGPMWDELMAVFREVAESADDRVLVLTGSGGAFCAGADLSPVPGDPHHQLDKMHHFGWVGLALHEIPKPTIAKVNGVAVGAGLNLALGCDLIVAGESARFSEIFVKRGLAIDLGGSWLLPRLVGLHKAKELALLGDMLDAKEAEPELIYSLTTPCFGRGLASEASRAVIADAFERLGFTRVLARTDPPNRASLEVMKRLGMQYEGEAVEDGLPTVSYTLAREDWQPERG